MALPGNRTKKDIRLFVIIAALLTIIGLVFIYSSSSVFALEKFGSDYFFLRKQAFFLLPSIAGFFFFALYPLEKLRKMVPYLFLAALLLTALTFVPMLGVRAHGSNRWLSLGFMSFQPSELLKFFIIMFMGYFLDLKKYQLSSFWKMYVPFLAVLGVTFGLLLKQPDFGSVVTIFSTALILFFVAECNLLYLAATAVAALPLIVYLVATKSYRLNRILIFLNPWADPQGQGFQIIQSLIAIGSGNLWGVGLANSKQKFFYLPMQHTDFIFPIIAEEIGFVGSAFLLLLLLAFCFIGMRIALQAATHFGLFASLGFVAFLTLQSVINLMVSCGLVPTKGLGLPFISYGGTALVITWCMVGFVINAGRSGIE